MFNLFFMFFSSWFLFCLSTFLYRAKKRELTFFLTFYAFLFTPTISPIHLKLSYNNKEAHFCLVKASVFLRTAIF